CLIALVIILAMYFVIHALVCSDMPVMLIATPISPVIGLAMPVILLAMIFNTAVPSLYTFTARFFTVDTQRFRVAAVVVGIVAFSLGFIGFTDLVNTIYPLLGYVGFVI